MQLQVAALAKKIQRAASADEQRQQVNTATTPIISKIQSVFLSY
jgi:hypothetical protein